MAELTQSNKKFPVKVLTLVLIVLIMCLIGSQLIPWGVVEELNSLDYHEQLDKQVDGIQTGQGGQLTQFIPDKMSILESETEVHPYCKSVMQHNTIKAKEECNFSRLKDIFLSTGYYPNCTYWSENYTMESQFCKFSSINGHIGQCLAKKRFNKVALVGDSNVKKVLDALLSVYGKCQQLKIEKNPSNNRMQPDISYFTDVNETRGHITHQRHCSSCISQQYQCHLNPKESIIIDYISMEYLLDTEITNVRFSPPKIDLCKIRGFDTSRPCPQSHSTQQFIYKQYFRQSGYPDLILHFLGDHDKTTLDANEVLMAAEMLGRMIDMYVPKTSRVVLLSKMYAEMHLKPPAWKKVVYEKQYNTLEQIHRVNQASAKGFYRVLAQNPIVDVYFDLFTIGRGVSRKLGKDGIHKKPLWYIKFWENFSRVLCQN